MKGFPTEKISLVVEAGTLIFFQFSIEQHSYRIFTIYPIGEQVFMGIVHTFWIGKLYNFTAEIALHFGI